MARYSGIQYNVDAEETIYNAGAMQKMRGTVHINLRRRHMNENVRNFRSTISMIRTFFVQSSDRKYFVSEYACCE